jgi:uncharacterized protein (TIGR02217 family)
VAFFRAIAQGRTHGFRFHDFGAGESIGTDEPIGTGTGSSATYQLIKRYTIGVYSFDRTITKPVAGTLIVKVNGVATTSFTVDTTNGEVTINATNGAAITASYQFQVPVRFDQDRLDIRRLDAQAYDLSNITLTETRDFL